MSSRRKGRRFELDLYNDLKQIMPNISMSKWSGGQADEPGDLYTKKMLFEVKRINKASANKIAAWYKKLLAEAKSVDKSIAILIIKEDYRDTTVYFNLSVFTEADCIVQTYYESFKTLFVSLGLIE